MKNKIKPTLSGCLSTLFLTALSLAATVVVMIYGWGLEPKNWWIIIGVGFFFNRVLRVIGEDVLDEMKKD